MSNESKATKWLEDNTDLSWTRTRGDGPQVKRDSSFINRSEAYEIRDFILRYYKECNLEHKDSNYQITLKKIISYKKGEKVKTEELLNHLKGTLEK